MDLETGKVLYIQLLSAASSLAMLTHLEIGGDVGAKNNAAFGEAILPLRQVYRIRHNYVKICEVVYFK